MSDESLPAPQEPTLVDFFEPAGADRNRLAALESHLCPETAAAMPVQHHFSRGLYARELMIPKGYVVVGKIHRHSQINVLLRGHVTILTEDGLRDFLPGDMIISPPGVKRAAYAHEDSSWLTVHGTQETDLDRLEAELICQSFEEFDAEQKLLAQGE